MKDDKRIVVKPITHFEGEWFGSAEMDIRLMLSNTEEKSVRTFSGTACSMFEGLSWEDEVIWLAAQHMINVLGIEKETVREGLERVTEII